MRLNVQFTVLSLVGLLLGIILITQFVSASNGSSNERKCLIIVSGYGGYNQNELDKASSFRDYLLEDMSEDDIIFLTDTSDPDSDGPANITNVENAFAWLNSSCDSNTEAIVYISDHIVGVNGERRFLFNDGNISTTTIDSWLDEVDYSQMTIVLNGERSGIGGLDLTGSFRDVICSMTSYQDFDPDLFDISRSLNDISADLDHDGKVSFIEAYWKEVTILLGTGQDPVLYN